MSSIDVLVLAGFIVVVAFAVMYMYVSVFVGEVSTSSRGGPLSAFLDRDGDLLVCVQNPGPNEYYSEYAVVVGGRRANITGTVEVGGLVGLRGHVSLDGPLMGDSVYGEVVTPRGYRYPVTFAVVADVDGLSCG